MKEAREILRVSTKTIQRWDKAGKIQCVRTPGNRRLIPESEILNIIGEIKPLTAPKLEIEPKEELKALTTEEQPPTLVVEEPKKPTPPAELPRHAILDRLTPAGLAQRTAFGALLSASMALRSFAIEEISARAQCPVPIAKLFCERMIDLGYLLERDGRYELRVKVGR